MKDILLFFNKYTNIGYLNFNKVEKYLKGKTSDFFNLGYFDLKKIGFRPETIANIINGLKVYNYNNELEILEKNKIKICSIYDVNYPKLLKKIHNPPQLLFYKGFLKEDDVYFSVIGARKYTEYGKTVTLEFTEFLSEYFTIVSGFAYGIDTFSHLACVKKRKRTVAVMGCGLNISYPKTNYLLGEKIIENNGALISEFYHDVQPERGNFPRRNRIISGMSTGVLVVEAAKKSGTFITANYSLDQGRDVFVVPGSIYSPHSVGTNILIKTGANVVTDPKEISMFLKQDKVDINKNLNEREKMVYNLLSHKPINIEYIVKNTTQLTVKEVSSVLCLFEIRGMVKNIGNMTYVLI